ncbi:MULTISPECIES: universal stress protein [Myxococcaceae]|uniref:universal stress protein n=1 Tax=Myxococcaceae TaxID=31 RepID=UPI0018901F18|nr:universal stress protein [Simulacricoccus sp. 17bor-14]
MPPAPPAQRPVQHILVGIDGSESSRRAARFAFALAEPLGARLTLLLVLEPPRVLSFGPLDGFAVAGNPMDPAHLAAARALLQEVGAGVPPERVAHVVEVGEPADTLCAQAEALGADLVVVGARGQAAAGRWLLGSVSDRVVHHARRPVTVVH